MVSLEASKILVKNVVQKLEKIEFVACSLSIYNAYM